MDTRQFEDALNRLSEMLCEYARIETLPHLLQEAVKESLLQRFEYTQEMAWKTAKRYLTEVEGFDGMIGPKTVLRICGELGLLDPEAWFLYIEARQSIAHDYSGAKAAAVLEDLDDFRNEAARFLAVLQERIRAGSGGE